MPNPAPTRHRIITFATPRVADQVFYELFDTQSLSDPPPDYGTPHPDTDKFPDHKLSLIRNADDDGRFVRFYYILDFAQQDEYNWEHTPSQISGLPYNAVTRTYVRLREDYDPLIPIPTADMPITAADPFTSGQNYILLYRTQRRTGDDVFDSLYVTEQHVYMQRVPIRFIGFDELFQKPIVTSEMIYYRDEPVYEVGGAGEKTMKELMDDSTHPYWGLGADGALRQGKQLSDNWYSVTTNQVVPTDGSNQATHSYFTTQNFRWPAVLNTIAFDGWDKRAGGTAQFPRPIYDRYAYSGPSKALVEVTWTKANHGTLTPDPAMQPLPIAFATPYARVSVPATLHAAPQNYTVTSGTEDPTWEYTGGTYSFPATNYTDWPATLVVQDSQRPFRGGWLREKITIYRPDTTP